MQVIVQTRTTAVPAEETGRQVLQITSPDGLEATGLFVPAVEQAIEILLDIALTAPYGLGVAEQKENARRRTQLVARDAAQQAVEQFDGSGFVAMDAR